MTLQNPKVTVLMPVYNGEKYVSQAIESVLTQTFTDFEFLIINDGSNDKSEEIITSYQDARIRLVTNETNLKLIATLNKGLNLAKGEYIARMDCDDICYPERLAMQVEFMDKHREVGVCGTWVETMGLKSGEVWRYPSEPEDIAARLFFLNAMAHPTVMIRRSFFQQHHLYYRSEYIHVEDFALWQQCRLLFSLANIPQPLLKYRIVQTSVTRTHWEDMEKSRRGILAENLETLKIENIDQKLNLFQEICSLRVDFKQNSLAEVEDFLTLILKQNAVLKLYPEPAFAQTVAEFWFLTCNTAASLGFKAWQICWRSSLSSLRKFTGMEKAKFFIKSLFKLERK